MLLATKLLSLLVYPLSLGLLLLLVAVISGAIGRRGLSWLMTLLAFLVIYFPATEFGSEALMQPLEGRHPAFSPEELPAADAIVLLGGASNGPARFGRGADLNDAADRVMFAAELYFAGKAPIILISGGAPTTLPPEAELLAQQLQALQIPRKQLLLESQSLTTYDNAVMAGVHTCGALWHCLKSKDCRSLRRQRITKFRSSPMLTDPAGYRPTHALRALPVQYTSGLATGPTTTPVSCEIQL
jgi:hypothetical protein